MGGWAGVFRSLEVAVGFFLGGSWEYGWVSSGSRGYSYLSRLLSLLTNGPTPWDLVRRMAYASGVHSTQNRLVYNVLKVTEISLKVFV